MKHQDKNRGHPPTSRPAHADRPEAGGGTGPSAPEEVSHEGCPLQGRRAPLVKRQIEDSHYVTCDRCGKDRTIYVQGMPFA